MVKKICLSCKKEFLVLKSHPKSKNCSKECSLKIWQINNKERLIQYKKEYYKKNRVKILNKVKVYRVKHHSQFYKSKKKYLKKKYEEDSIFKLKRCLNSRLYQILNQKSFNKNTKIGQLLGCDLSFLKKYLQKQFQKGMSWNNHGDWHMDHIIPLDSAKNIEEVQDLFHYTNLQPLWAKDNILKSNKI